MKEVVLLMMIVAGILSSCSRSNKRVVNSLELEQNKEIATSYILEVVNNRDLELLEKIFSPDYVSHNRNGTDTNSIKDGTLISFLEYFFKAFPDLHYRIMSVITEGDVVSLNLEASGTHRNEFLGFEASGNEVVFGEMFFFKLADNKIIEGWSVVDVELVKEQLKKQ